MKRKILTLIFTFLFIQTEAYGCPEINNLIDFNCDGRIRVGFLGDSITRGVGDDEDRGGYPGRVRRQLGISVTNIGVPGITSSRLLREVRRNIDRGRITTRKLSDLDYLFIAVGTNDFFDSRRNDSPAGLTLRNIRRTVNFLEEELARLNDVPPLISVSTLTRTLRGFQQPFIDEVNSLLLARRRKLNVHIRFDRLPSSIIGEDGLHPDSFGYQRMARRVRRTLNGSIQTEAGQQRTDIDVDGLYDEVESILFSTDPTLFDTDGDTHSDGEEVFTLMTDPNNSGDPEPS